MKVFKCGKCQEAYKIDEAKFPAAQIIVTCPTCSTKNKITLGPQLIAQSANGKTTSFLLKPGTNVLGRKRNLPLDGVLPIEDDFVSRKHAVIQIEQKDGKLFCTIEDQSSTNGTYNQQKSRLKPGLKYPFPPNHFFIIGLTKLTLRF